MRLSALQPWVLTNVIDRFERVFLAANRLLLIALLAAMSVIVFANVCLRYLTTESIVWGEEVARHMMIWLTFVGAGLVLRHGGHVAIDNLQDAIPRSAARLIRALITIALVAFAGAMIWYGHIYVERTMFQTTSATQIPFGYIYLAMPIGFGLIVVHMLLIARSFILDRRFKAGDGFDASTASSL